jgi:hypothetical protein
MLRTPFDTGGRNNGRKLLGTPLPDGRTTDRYRLAKQRAKAFGRSPARWEEHDVSFRQWLRQWRYRQAKRWPKAALRNWGSQAVSHPPTGIFKTLLSISQFVIVQQLSHVCLNLSIWLISHGTEFFSHNESVSAGFSAAKSFN